MDAKVEEAFAVHADGEITRNQARDDPGTAEREKNQGERVLYSTAQVLPPQSAPHLDWEQVGPFLLSPHGGLPWLC